MLSNFLSRNKELTLKEMIHSIFILDNLTHKQTLVLLILADEYDIAFAEFDVIKNKSNIEEKKLKKVLINLLIKGLIVCDSHCHLIQNLSFKINLEAMKNIEIGYMLKFNRLHFY